MVNGQMTCWRSAISYEHEVFLFNKAVELIEHFQSVQKQKEFLKEKDIKKVYRKLLILVTKNKKVIIGRNIDLLIEEYRKEHNLPLKITTRKIKEYST